MHCHLVVHTVFTVKDRLIVSEPSFVLLIAQQRQNDILSVISFQLFGYTKMTKKTKQNYIIEVEFISRYFSSFCIDCTYEF